MITGGGAKPTWRVLAWSGWASLPGGSAGRGTVTSAWLGQLQQKARSSAEMVLGPALTTSVALLR